MTTARKTWLLAGFATMAATVAQAQAVRSGFDANTLPPNDDGSTGLVDIGFEVDFFGVVSDQLYVNNNGNITFDSSLGTYTPFDLTSTGREIIAPFFADVDTSDAGDPVTYGQGTVDGNAAFAANYVNVDYFNSDPAHTNRNSFQVILIDQGGGNFAIEFNYDQIEWEAGEASGSNGEGLGGDSARVGFSNGTGDEGTFFELEGSAVNGAFLDSGPADTALVLNSLNSPVPGRYVFFSEGGFIIINPGSDVGVLATESAIALTQAQSDHLWKLSRSNRAARNALRGSGEDSAAGPDGTSAGRFSVWARAGGGKLDGSFGGDLDVDHFVAQPGLEYAVTPEFAIGLTLGGASVDARTADDSLDGDALFVEPYVSFGRGPISAVGSLIYTYTDYDDDGGNSVDRGDRFAAMANVGYDVAVRPDTTLTPFGYAAGGVEKLDYDGGDDEASFFVGRAGVEVAHALSLGAGNPADVEIFGSVAAQYVSGSAPDELGPTRLADYDDDRLGARVEAGFSYSPANSPISVFASANGGGIFTDATGYGGRIGVSVPF